MADHLTVVHECKDYTAWKAGFDADAPNRLAAGLTDLTVARSKDKPNVVAVVFRIGDLAKARAMVGSAGLRAAMEKAGVVGKPGIHFRRGEYTFETAPAYLTINCRVGDFATFKKGYAMDKADRQAATMTDRALLQDMDDPNDLLLAWSIDDVNKAMAFLKSPALAEHMKNNCSIVGEPELRFWTS